MLKKRKFSAQARDYNNLYLSLITEVHQILNDFESDRERCQDLNPSPKLFDKCSIKRERVRSERKQTKRKLDVKVGD